MKRIALFTLLGAVVCGSLPADDTPAPAEKRLVAANGVAIIVRAQGPYDADVPLQVVCYFKHKPQGDTTKGAPVELDKRLGGVISALRDRGEFVGDELETLLITSPPKTIKPQLLLLVGLGEEKSLTAATMERIGRVSLREAARLGVKRVAFAPLLRDQGNNSLSVGEVETAVIRGMLTAYDTELQLQLEHFAKAFSLEEWIVEAGPVYFDETIAGVEKGIAEAKEVTASRSREPYARGTQR